MLCLYCVSVTSHFSVITKIFVKVYDEQNKLKLILG